MRCAATTARGHRCRSRTKRGHDKCAAHLGAAHRPTKLTPDVQARIVQAIEAGNYLGTAARYGGIAPSTLHAWMQRGRDDAENGISSGFREFMEAVVRAGARAEVHAVAILRRAAAEGDWRAAAFLLERRWPERWGRSLRVRREASATVRVTPVELPDGLDRVRAVAEILRDLGVLDSGE